jgi:hypothetical protein
LTVVPTRWKALSAIRFNVMPETRKTKPVKFQSMGIIFAMGNRKCKTSMAMIATSIQVGGIIFVDFI